MNERQLSIIKLLLSKDREVQQLSKLFKVSSRTIRNDIEKINYELNNLSLPNIYNDRGRLSLSLVSEQKAVLAKYFKQGKTTYLSPEERILSIILDVISSSGQIKIYKEQEKLGISKSTMDKDMRAVRKYLAKFELKLKADQGAEIIGGEKRIRTMLQRIIAKNVDLIKLMSVDNEFEGNRSYETVLDYLGKNNISELNDLSENLLQNGRYVGNSAIKAQISFCLAIWFRRISQNYFLSKDFESVITPNDSITKIIKHFLSEKHQQVPRIELSYISYIIGVFRVKDQYSLAELTESQLLTIQLINYMSEKESINYQNSEKLYEQLNSHILAFLVRENNQVEVFNPLTSILRSNYTRIFQDVDNFFRNNYSINPSDAEKAYITIYFGAYYEKLSKRKKIYRIAVLCNYGEATGQLLAANLSNNFNSEIVAVLGIQDLDVLKRINIDFVVETIDVKLPVPSIKLQPVPTSEDYQKLDKFASNLHIDRKVFFDKEQANISLLKNIIGLAEKDLHVKVNANYVDSMVKLLKANHINISEKEVRPLIQDLLTDDKITLNIQATDWKDAINKAAAPLLRNKSIEKSYVKAMQDSVIKFGPYIVIGPHIALSHARPEDGVHKLDVSVGTLKDPIKFGSKQNDPVEIIFVLAAIDNYSHLNVLKAIVNLINDPKKVQRLCQINNVNEFKEILFKE